MIELRILEGGHAGATRGFSGSRVTVGRDPRADLRLHPSVDLAASAHHAVLARDDRGWFVRDLGSRNGTLVNGRRIEADTVLAHGDRIRFGTGGPEAEVVLRSGEARAGGGGEAGDTAERVRVGVARETRRIRAFWAVMALVLAGLLYLAESARRNDRDAWESERTLLLSRVDSALAARRVATATLQGRVSGLEEALRDSRSEVESLRAQAAALTSEPDPDQLRDLQQRLLTATEALRRQQLAASLDFEAIERANRRAVTLVLVEAANGEVALATGFAVRADGTVVTSKHIFGDGQPSRPRQLGVQFADSRQVFPARVLGASETHDLAVLRLDNLSGSVPVVRGINAAPDTVDVVAMMGFPLSAAPAVRVGEREPADPLVSAGIVTSRGPARIEIQGFGAPGASGSPVFDGGGSVVGVVFGGRSDEADPLVVAVPAAEVERLLERVLR